MKIKKTGDGIGFDSGGEDIYVPGTEFIEAEYGENIHAALVDALYDHTVNPATPLDVDPYLGLTEEEFAKVLAMEGGEDEIPLSRLVAASTRTRTRLQLVVRYDREPNQPFFSVVRMGVHR